MSDVTHPVFACPSSTQFEYLEIYEVVGWPLTVLMDQVFGLLLDDTMEIDSRW